MKIIAAILFFLFLGLPLTKGQKEMGNVLTVEKWAIEQQSSLTIDGRSNVNTFKCGVKEFLRTDTLVYMSYEGIQKRASLKGSVTININRFDCGHKFMTNDLRKTLKSDENPNLVIRFISMDKIRETNMNQVTKGIVEIQLAGVTKQYEVNYAIQNNNKNMILTGNRKILFSDFSLKPPTRLAGLIKVEEELNVQFQLMLKPVQ
ncbi:MAG: YceI family protein [Sphingobacteriales bacterium]|nr:MAG: YceI family protein [Sphingobacteriales bacterium]